jgi:Ca-activated chloride channel family protein
MQRGRRASFGGFISGADKDTWNPEWGINTQKILSPIKYPRKEVLEQILQLYQNVLRKPSYTIFCLDFSGSMGGRGERLLKQAMRTILDQRLAKQYYIGATNNDVTLVIAFADHIRGKWKVVGNNQEAMLNLLHKIQGLRPGGKTDIYTPSMIGLRELDKISINEYMPAVIIMTDGISNYGARFEDLRHEYQNIEKDIPIFSIRFGAADKTQLMEIKQLTGARIFDGRKDLITAFKKAKGYN